MCQFNTCLRYFFSPSFFTFCLFPFAKRENHRNSCVHISLLIKITFNIHEIFLTLLIYNWDLSNRSKGEKLPQMTIMYFTIPPKASSFFLTPSIYIAKEKDDDGENEPTTLYNIPWRCSSPFERPMQYSTRSSAVVREVKKDGEGQEYRKAWGKKRKKACAHTHMHKKESLTWSKPRTVKLAPLSINRCASNHLGTSLFYSGFWHSLVLPSPPLLSR